VCYGIWAPLAAATTPLIFTHIGGHRFFLRHKRAKKKEEKKTYE
jgi:hypothetical protein